MDPSELEKRLKGTARTENHDFKDVDEVTEAAQREATFASRHAGNGMIITGLCSFTAGAAFMGFPLLVYTKRIDEAVALGVCGVISGLLGTYLARGEYKAIKERERLNNLANSVYTDLTP